LDTKLYVAALRQSNDLYNKGLAQAKVFNLSSAIETLERSVIINKSNIHARNLLGLIQYEVGYVGDALKNWVISWQLQRNDNPAKKYIDTVQKNARVLERLDDAVNIYNQALNDLWQSSEDIAIIKLKQAIELNPKFIDALNLLTLCYIMRKDRPKAMQTAEQVLEIDGSNTTALSYYGEMNPTYRNNASKRNARKRAIASKEPPSTAYNRQVTLHERSPVNFHLAEILSFVVGAACMFGALYILVFPQLDRNNAQQVEYAESRLAQVQQAYNSLSTERERELAEAETNILQLEGAIQELSDSYDTLTRTFNIFAAFDLLQEGRLREAADVLGNIDTAGLAPDVAERANYIRDIVYPQLTQTYYNEGVAANNAHDFERALADFERALYFAEHGDPNMFGEVMYFLAWVHSQEAIGNRDMAIHYFERLFEEFPDHPRIPPARQRFDYITS